MRILYKASLVFLLKDIYSKLPVTHAVILCNGKQNPYTRKKEGHYVFSNLYPGNYDIEIDCKGYNSLRFSIDIRENETKEIITDLSYAPDNQNITNLTRLEINCIQKKKLLKDIPVTLKLKNELTFLKLLEPVKSGTDKLKLNVDMITHLLCQKYVYEVGKKSYPLFLWSYDQENKVYILKDNVNEEIKPEGKFYAVWDVRTDYKGKIIMPLMNQFMKSDVLDFECLSEGIKSNISVDVNGKYDSGEIIYTEANFRKLPKVRVKTEEQS